MRLVRDFALLLAAAASTSCFAQCGPEFIPGDQIPGVSAGAGVGSIRAALEWDSDGPGSQASKLIVAGTFTDAGGSPAPNLALWDGSRWSAFGTGANGTVARLAAFNGEVIAAGTFTVIGGVSVPGGLAAFDGVAWRALPTPGEAGGAPSQLLVHGGLLYASGLFTFGGTAGNYVASFNGTTWTPVGASFDGPINDIAPYNGELLAGGAFTTSGASAAFCLARWDGANWSTFAGGANDAVNCIRQFGTDLYVGGVFTGVGSPAVLRHKLAKWSGTAWATVVANTVFSEVQTLGGTATTLVAGGIRQGGSRPMKYFTLAGHAAMPPTEAELGGNFDNDIFWIGSYQGRVHLAGTFQAVAPLSGDIKHFSIARVIDNRWHALTGGLNGRIKAIAHYQGQVFGAGDFTRWKDTPVSKLVTWNGTDWVQFNINFPAGMQETNPELLKSFNGRLYINGNAANYLQASWNGSAWSGWPSGVNSPHALMEFIGNRLMAGTSSGWRQLTAPFPDIYAPAFARAVWTSIPYGTGFMVGGNFTAAGGTPAVGVANFNGTVWSAVGQGLSTAGGGTVYKLLDVGGVPHAFGSFNATGATPLNGAARWTGSAWVPVGTAPFDTPFTSVRDAAAQDGKIFVVGDFSFSNPANGLMEFDGTAWHSRGGLTGEGVFSFTGGQTVTLVGDEVWITGQFARTGGLPSYQFARYRLTSATPGPHIDTQPDDTAVHRGEPASFTVEASGTGTLNYQWRRNGQPLEDNDSGLPTLTIASAVDADRGLYDCVVTDQCGTEVTSSPARLTILTADLGVQGGGPGSDNNWDNNDFIAFIGFFFTLDPAADVGQQGGLPGGDGAWDNNDFIVFINLFFEAV